MWVDVFDVLLDGLGVLHQDIFSFFNEFLHIFRSALSA